MKFVYINSVALDGCGAGLCHPKSFRPLSRRRIYRLVPTRAESTYLTGLDRILNMIPQRQIFLLVLSFLNGLLTMFGIYLYKPDVILEAIA
jgi:hypothetical protein